MADLEAMTSSPIAGRPVADGRRGGRHGLARSPTYTDADPGRRRAFSAGGPLHARTNSFRRRASVVYSGNSTTRDPRNDRPVPAPTSGPRLDAVLAGRTVDTRPRQYASGAESSGVTRLTMNAPISKARLDGRFEADWHR